MSVLSVFNFVMTGGTWGGVAIRLDNAWLWSCGRH